MAPVIKEIEKSQAKSIVVVTAQHRKLLDQVLEVFSINPDFDLDIMKENQDLYWTTIQILQKLRDVLKEVKPDIVLVQGDTTTTFVGGLAAFYEKIPLGHIEAGLRSGNKYSPYPEEMNRKFTDTLADFCFAPTQIARENLLREGIPQERIWITGNTGIDALFMVLNKNYSFKNERLKEIISSRRKIVLVTAHRRESFGRGEVKKTSPLRNICLAILELKNRFKDIEVVYSVHPNPNVRKPVYEILNNTSRIYLIEPPEYLCFCNLMKRADLILTDSGGIQEEAPSIGKPVLVMREVTERVEGITAGTAILVGTDRQKIVEEASLLLSDEKKYKAMSKLSNPYGDGKASQRIINIILKFFELPYSATQPFREDHIIQ